MKQFVGALALIRRDAAVGNEWLTQWNAGRECFALVEAHKLHGESFRQSLVREIEWSVGLRSGKDYLVSSAPRAHLEVQHATAVGSEPATFVVEFYLVELMGRSAASTIERDPRNRWVTPAEFQAGRCADGRPLCPTQCRLLAQADVISPWDE